ncbi:cytochrome c oxidase assembly protein [Azospirillum isscasi]|uniref:Cytochrome c oxidase assembly protein n=1 Tax=Azospirillum isscasi TaxID=3053926 RepID=A0ABU0WA85_9PROT|nr:cytochrome c oxidase assembly protein [Azospirillum isscasi]MDQ2101091.1 cytochrome c oxidase assembly protein [Azospirillum isscasi]
MPFETPPSVIPYCGPPPVPEEFWSAWNGDPVLLAVFALAAAGYATVVHRRRAGMERHQPWCFAAGWLVLFAAFVSPLCNLTSALFSARVVQHLLTIQVAAPLLVLSWPAGAVRWPAWLRKSLGIPEIAWGLFGLFLWVWHLPGPYMAALRSDAVLWVMHGSLLIGAVAAWRAVLVPEGAAMRARGLLSAFGTSVHLAILAALLIFAPQPLFVHHLVTTAPWGLSALADQQLGGLIMGVVGAAVYVVLNLYALARWLMVPERQRT